MPTMVAAKNCLDWHCPTPIQIGVAEFIAEGHLARHVRKMLKIYKERREYLLRSLNGEANRWLVPIPSFYGVHVAALARNGVDLDPVVEGLRRDNVKIHTLERYFLGTPTRSGLVFGYGAVTLAEMSLGLAKLIKRLQKAQIG
jgi:GntR family transcriptional regulator/MocR family aminotransferase